MASVIELYILAMYEYCAWLFTLVPGNDCTVQLRSDILILLA